jgi:hypothetical protein
VYSSSISIFLAAECLNALTRPSRPIRDLVSQQRVELPGLAVNDQAKIDILSGGEFLGDPGKRLRQVLNASIGGTQSPKSVPAFFDHLGHQVQHAVQSWFRG